MTFQILIHPKIVSKHGHNHLYLILEAHLNEAAFDFVLKYLLEHNSRFLISWD